MASQSNITDKLFKAGEIVEITDSNNTSGLVKIIQVKQGWVRIEAPSDKDRESEQVGNYSVYENVASYEFDSGEEAIWMNINKIVSVKVFRSQRHAKINNW